MTNADFFDSQSDLTAAKIKVYRDYLSGYLHKVLMQFGRCYIADLFCGCGKNGDKDGSPLVLLKLLGEILDNPILIQKFPSVEVIIVFNDIDNACAENLKTYLKGMEIHKRIKIFGPFCEDFVNMKSKFIKTFEYKKIPKFIFLDPFTYSKIDMTDVKAFMDMPAAEVLLFLPTFFSFRFVKCAGNVPKLKNFLQGFTVKRCADYDGIDDFNESIRKKLMNDIGLEYVRAVRLDDGSRKNALFYMTKHITGMLLMNDLVWKLAEDGQMVKAKSKSESMLFDTSQFTDNYKKSADEFRNFIREKGTMSNVEIIHHVAKNGFTTAYARDILKELKTKGIIKLLHKKANGRGFYVANDNWNNDMANIKYLGE